MCKLLEHSIELTVSNWFGGMRKRLCQMQVPKLSFTDFHCKGRRRSITCNLQSGQTFRTAILLYAKKKDNCVTRTTGFSFNHGSAPHSYTSIPISVRRGMMMKKEDVTTSQSDASYRNQTGLHELDHNGSLPLSDPLYRLSTILEPRANL